MPKAPSRGGAARPRRAAIGRGFVISGCRPEAAVSWAKRGFAPLTVASVDGYTVVVPTGRPVARPPYDEPVRVLAARPVSFRMRPALGFFLIGRQAVLTVHPMDWRPMEKWVVWTPRDGWVDLPDLAAATTADVVAAAVALEQARRRASGPADGQLVGRLLSEWQAGARVVVGGGQAAEHLADPATGHAAAQAEETVWTLLRNGNQDATSVLVRVLSALGLPGAQLVTGELDVASVPDACLVLPRVRHARAFDRIVTEADREAKERGTFS